MALRAVPLVGGPVELRGALDLEITQAGVMPRRLPAWTKEQYQDPSVYGVTVMPSGVRLVFRTDARELEFEVLTSTGQLDSDPHLARPGCWSCWSTVPWPGVSRRRWATCCGWRAPGPYSDSSRASQGPYGSPGCRPA